MVQVIEYGHQLQRHCDEMSDGNVHKKFDSIDDALKFINDQLSLKGYILLDSNGDGDEIENKHKHKHERELITLNNTIEDKKLVINTISKLLNNLESKNVQLQKLSDEKNRLNKLLNKEVLEKNSIQKDLIYYTQKHTNKVTKPLLPQPRQQPPSSNVATLQKNYKIKINKLQTTIDELRDTLVKSKYKKLDADLMWNIHKDITTISSTPESSSGTVASEDDSAFFKKYNDLIQLRSNLVKFLNLVNKLTYQKNIHHFTKLNIDFTGSNDNDPNSPDFSLSNFSKDPEIYELINDFIEIIHLTNTEHMHSNTDE